MTKIFMLYLFVVLFGHPYNENIDNYLNTLHDDGKLNGNVLVIKDGETLYEKSFGYSDGSQNTLLTKGYRFNIGSIYKEFPAVAIMQLQEDKLLKLEDNNAMYIPDLPVWAEQVSIQNLLQYSSGLPTVGWNTYFSQGINITEEDIMNEIKAITQLEFEPGSDYLYSNMNPILLIKIIENITNTSFNSYLQQHIFTPFKMDHTVVKDQYPYVDKTFMAIPFNEDFEEDDYKLSVKSLLFSSTASDLAAWFIQLDDFKIVNQHSLKTLSQKAKEGDNIQSPLGYSEWNNDDIIEHSHHGSTASYECVVRNFKKDGITIVILTNQKHSNVYEISDRIYEILKP